MSSQCTLCTHRSRGPTDSMKICNLTQYQHQPLTKCKPLGHEGFAVRRVVETKRVPRFEMLSTVSWSTTEIPAQSKFVDVGGPTVAHRGAPDGAEDVIPCQPLLVLCQSPKHEGDINPVSGTHGVCVRGHSNYFLSLSSTRERSQIRRHRVLLGTVATSTVG